MDQMPVCVYCSLPEIQQRRITENNLAWAFLTNIPITSGHTLVCPKRCVAALADLTDAEKLAILELAEKVMASLRQAVAAEGFNCAWNQEKLAGQSVPHFHLHIVPRRSGDTGLLGYDPRSCLYRTGDREPSPDGELLVVRDRLKDCL